MFLGVDKHNAKQDRWCKEKKTLVGVIAWHLYLKISTKLNRTEIITADRIISLSFLSLINGYGSVEKENKQIRKICLKTSCCGF